ncbi:hypothetical protein [Paenibacillus sp. S150]|uniref:hypothetical protein n=1 Tax=Paenibacillus sp. S150 TaxID=2749826 RepID=UPI001C585593|nr:hypothetical protein [Paenibacillus sp. S150]MBW4080415.1 hypothetical protein [Paenibacillus sp. S150]
MNLLPGAFLISGLGLMIWLAVVVICIYMFILFVKLARRGITALDLYIYAKNREIRERYETAYKEGPL